MAIVTEYFRTRSDGVVLNRTYSDLGIMIEREGVRYSEAIDPAELNRVYTETDEPVPEAIVDLLGNLSGILHITYYEKEV